MLTILGSVLVVKTWITATICSVIECPSLEGSYMLTILGSVSALISIRGLRRLIWVDTLRRGQNVGTAHLDNCVFSYHLTYFRDIFWNISTIYT